MARQPSLAEKTLEACRLICSLAHDLHAPDPEVAKQAFQSLYTTLGALEEIARRRVDTSTYENHRRAMEACHITLPAQVSRG